MATVGERIMGVKGFAGGLIVLGVALGLYGWRAWNPVAFVGLALAVLGAVVLITGRRGRGPTPGA
jgi:CHASE2 domain-containing sensor protein